MCQSDSASVKVDFVLVIEKEIYIATVGGMNQELILPTVIYGHIPLA